MTGHNVKHITRQYGKGMLLTMSAKTFRREERELSHILFGIQK